MDNTLKTGYIMAVISFLIWGFAPIYFKAIQQVSPFEIVAHRVIWSVFTLAAILYLMDKNFVAKIIAGFKSHFWVLASAAFLLTANWLMFIYSISTGRILEASLGYYINPLVNVALGAIFLGERFSNLKKIAVLLAIIGVAQEVFRFGQIPFISLFLAATFGTYGLIRKKADIGGSEGLLIETMIMMPFAIAYLLYLQFNQQLVFLHSDLSISLLLLAAGLVTSLPLIFFIGASKRLKYSTLGMFQYIGPTLMGILGYYFYNESFPEGRLMTFGLVWLGLLLTVIESFRKRI
jgi:chloramphenicol-sensitive protein RarD